MSGEPELPAEDTDGPAEQRLKAALRELLQEQQPRKGSGEQEPPDEDRPR
jgi:hypothetical protein